MTTVLLASGALLCARLSTEASGAVARGHAAGRHHPHYRPQHNRRRCERRKQVLLSPACLGPLSQWRSPAAAADAAQAAACRCAVAAAQAAAASAAAGSTAASAICTILTAAFASAEHVTHGITRGGPARAEAEQGCRAGAKRGQQRHRQQQVAGLAETKKVSAPAADPHATKLPRAALCGRNGLSTQSRWPADCSGRFLELDSVQDRFLPCAPCLW